MNLKESKINHLENEDNFKKLFKYFKNRKNELNWKDIQDFDSFKPFKPVNLPHKEEECLPPKLGLNSTQKWMIHTISDHKGLYIICNAFTEKGAMSWISRCLQEFSKAPYKNNLSNLNLYPSSQDWWKEVKDSLACNGNSETIRQLRWATMGYHHNWDTKEYAESEQSQMPDGLQELCHIFLRVIGYGNAIEFKAEAAIVNYYPPGSTLSPHTDHSERDTNAPLLSFSFGQSGVFLIGGLDKNITPTPMFLDHGDVLIMTKESRLCYHAVPRILTEKETNSRGNDKLKKFMEEFSDKGKVLRENRKDFCEGQNDLENLASSSVKGNSALDKFIPSTQEEVEAILNYMKRFRININVRQVNSHISPYTW